MTPLQREALRMCLEYIETDAHGRRHVRWKINEALAQPQQEPVAWVRWEWNRSGLKSLVFKKPEELSLAETATGVVYDPLYASPPAQPQQELVAKMGMYEHKCPDVTGHRGPSFVCQKAGHGVGQNSYCNVCTCPEALNTSPQPAQRKPLTDEQIESIAARTLFPIAFARAIEAAHGIKENT